MPQSYDVSDMGMIGDARAGAITVGVDGGSQFCLDSSSLHLDDVPEAALARHGLAASALSMPVRHCAPKGGSTAVCRWRAGPHPSVSLVTARSVHREPSDRTQSEFLSMDPCDVPASPSIRMADGLRRVLREQAFCAAAHVVHPEPGGTSPQGRVAAGNGALFGPTRPPTRGIAGRPSRIAPCVSRIAPCVIAPCVSTGFPSSPALTGRTMPTGGPCRRAGHAD